MRVAESLHSKYDKVENSSLCFQSNIRDSCRGERGYRSLYGYITSPWLILNTSPSSLLDSPHSRQREERIHSTIVPSRLGGVCGDLVEDLFGQGRSDYYRSRARLSYDRKAYTDPRSGLSYRSRSEIAKRFSYKRLKSTSTSERICR